MMQHLQALRAQGAQQARAVESSVPDVEGATGRAPVVPAEVRTWTDGTAPADATAAVATTATMDETQTALSVPEAGAGVGSAVAGAMSAAGALDVVEVEFWVKYRTEWGVVEYKYCVVHYDSGTARNWQPGNNSVLVLAGGEDAMQVYDSWGGNAGAALVVPGAQPTTREARLLEWAEQAETRMSSQARELRAARRDLETAHEETRRARQESARVRAQLAHSERGRLEAAASLRSAQLTNNLLQTQLAEMSASFRAALETASEILRQAPVRRRRAWARRSGDAGVAGGAEARSAGGIDQVPPVSTEQQPAASTARRPAVSTEAPRQETAVQSAHTDATSSSVPAPPPSRPTQAENVAGDTSPLGMPTKVAPVERAAEVAPLPVTVAQEDADASQPSGEELHMPASVARRDGVQRRNGSGTAAMDRAPAADAAHSPPPRSASDAARPLQPSHTTSPSSSLLRTAAAGVQRS